MNNNNHECLGSEQFGLITQGQNAISLAGVTMIGAINQEICISRVHSPFRGKLDKDLCQCARRIQAIFRGCGRGSRLAFAWHKLKTRSIAVSFQDSTFMGLFSLCMWGRASREWAFCLLHLFCFSFFYTCWPARAQQLRQRQRQRQRQFHSLLS
jgi:hypothetical protein